MSLATAHLLQRLPGPMAAFLGLAVLAAIIFFWEALQHVDTMAHEGAHAFVNACMGGTTEFVEIKSSGDGQTKFVSGGGVASGVAGYLGPGACGLIAAAMIHHGQIFAVLWAGVILLLILLCSIRTLFGAAAVISLCLFLLLVARDAPAFLQVVTAYSLSWLLLLSGMRMAFAHGTKAGDAQILRDYTGLPKTLWAGLWLMGSILALAVGCTLLV
jgi:peptidase M50B-like protein